ncbi:chaperonin 10-like protein [Chiua virens]|nr:chaperonin 10-like protein [Chiua virens]
MAPQTALWLPAVGSDFKLGKSDIPEPGPGEVLVKVEATALNPIDWVIQKVGFFMVREYPTIIGENGAGVVTKVGEGVTNLVKGDRVLFQTAYGVKYGTFQEYCLADAELASKLPDNISFDEGAPIATCINPFAIATYAQPPQGLGFVPPFEPGGLGSAKRAIFIMGGASSLGQYGIQLAKLSGFHPIMTTASLHNTALLLSLGATHVIDRTLPASALKEEAVKAMGPGKIEPFGLTYVFDTVCTEETEKAAYHELLTFSGTLVVVNDPLIQEEEGGLKRIKLVNGSFHIPENRALGIKFAAALTGWLAEGAIKPNPVEVLPGGLNGIVEGLKRLEAGSVSAKKLVVRPPETRA